MGTRTKNTVFNIISSFQTYGVSLLLSFVSRTVFIKTLGAEYLGVNGVFADILSMLSLAELGFGEAITFHLYKPLSQGDNVKVAQLMQLYKRAYQLISMVIFSIGICIIPFIKYIVKDIEGVHESIYLLYLLFLFNTVVSYLLCYRRSLLTAAQKDYYINIISTIVNTLQIIAQIISLIMIKNYIMFLIIQITGAIVNNIIISAFAAKKYPFLKEKITGLLDKETKESLATNIKAIIIYKVGGQLVSGIDSIIVSAFVNTVSVGFLSNYSLVINKAVGLVDRGIQATLGSVGNYNATESNEKKEFLYRVFLFITAGVYTCLGSILLAITNDIIRLWGEKYVMSQAVLIVQIAGLFIIGMHQPTTIFRNTMGLYRYGKFVPMIGAAISCFFSVILVQYYGVIGVLLGTLITRLAIVWWYDPLMIYRHGLHMSSGIYFFRYSSYYLVYIISTGYTYVLSSKCMVGGLLGIMIKACIAVLTSLVLFILANGRKEEFKFLIKFTKQKLKTR